MVKNCLHVIMQQIRANRMQSIRITLAQKGTSQCTVGGSAFEVQCMTTGHI